MKYIKLEKIFKYLPKSKIKAGEGKDKGVFPFFTSSSILSKYYDEYLFDGEYLIFATGGSASVNYYNGKFATSTDNFIVQVSDQFYTKFLYYYLKLNIDMIQHEFHGAGLQHLSKKGLDGIEVPLINKDIQKKIIDKIDLLENSIKSKEEEKDNHNKIMKSLYYEMINSNELKEYKFSECVENMTKGPFGSDIKKSLYVPKSVDTYKVYIQVNAIQKNQSLGDYYISKEYFDSKMKRFELFPEDYIITCDGTLGKFLKLDNTMEKGIISASLLKLKLKDNIICDKVFELTWDNYMLPILKGQTRNAALVHLPSATVIGDLTIKIPDINIQNKYKKKIDLVYKMISINEKIVENLKVLEKAVILSI